MDDGRVISRKTKEPVGSFDKSSGYWRVKVNNRSWLLHRLVFFMEHGWLPDFVDHEDRDTGNNTVGNLRPCEKKGQNTINSLARSDNTSGYKGVTWHKSSKKWHSSVFKEGKRHYLGVYEDIKMAALAYNRKAKELFGEFAVLNEVD